MSKRRVTLNLDADVVAALESLGGRSLSAAANDALRRAVAGEANRAALLRWLDELDEAHGAVSPEDEMAIAAFVDELAGPSSDAGAA
jgi:hypothetical protein